MLQVVTADIWVFEMLTVSLFIFFTHFGGVKDVNGRSRHVDMILQWRD
jgi:hypothetical protein